MQKEQESFQLMHGSIFVLLKNYVEKSSAPGTWQNLLQMTEVNDIDYRFNEMYPTDDLFAIIHQISDSTNTSVYDLMEEFGEYIVPDLINQYKAFLEPEWRTYEMLVYTEERMHGAVRKQDQRTAPPKLVVAKKGENRLIINYYSPRRMAGVAVGIIRGIARYYNEFDKVKVTRLSKPEAEDVLILVDFDVEADHHLN